MPQIELSGVRLHVDVGGQGPALLLLHGFTGSGADWDHHLPVLEPHFTVVRVDHVGHARSEAPDEPGPYRMERYVDTLQQLMERLDIRAARVVGYSLGGRVALQLAVTAPERVRRLLLESASPGLMDPDERQQRLERDRALAQRIEAHGVESFVDAWERLPLFGTQRSLPPERWEGQRRTRLSHTARGLANSLRGMGTGAYPGAWDRLHRLAMPVLLLTGKLDPKFCRLAADMKRSIPHARHVVVPDVGHNIHLEAPAVFERLLLDFLLPEDV